MTVSGDNTWREHGASLKEIVVTDWRLLTLRLTPAELQALGFRHLAFGLVCAWLVGIGRTWDNVRASFWQHTGLGSVVYVFAFALLLWLVVLPLRPRHWSYLHVCTFVALVAPPALLYALPVERWLTLDAANTINACFLAVVATWRVLLLFFYLTRHAGLQPRIVPVVALLPLTLIVTILTMLNLDRVVFDFMGGMHDRSPNDLAYVVLVWLTLLSLLSFGPLLLGYIVLVVQAQMKQGHQALKVNGDSK